MKSEEVVLIIEDEINCTGFMAEPLEQNGIHSVVKPKWVSASRILSQAPISLVILDLDLSAVSGVTVLQDIRAHSNVPVLVITAHQEDELLGKCWRFGATDYLYKPFKNGDLVGKVNDLLTRQNRVILNLDGESQYCHDGLDIDFVTGNVMLEGQTVFLSLTEYRILGLLAHWRGTFVETITLLKCIWPHESYHDDLGLVRVNIARLRRKLRDEAASPKYIANEPGKGYCLIE